MNRKYVKGPWGGGNLFVKAFVEEMTKFGHEVIHKFEDKIDVIFIQDPRYDELGISFNEALQYKRYFPNTILVQRVNECDARKNTNDIDSMLRECSQHIDHTFFVSNWMKIYHVDRGWKCQNNSVIVNGVDDFFKPQSKINNGKINIVTHHWSNNLLKGFDIYDRIDNELSHRNDITFTYIGRDRNTFKNTKLISPLYGQDLARELGKYDVYISASRWDPGPNHVIEAIACEIPTYVHEDSGGGRDFAGDDHTFKDWDHLVDLIDKKSFSQNLFKTRSWEDCIIEVNSKLNEIALLKC